jgi:hypothetical protein
VGEIGHYLTEHIYIAEHIQLGYQHVGNNILFTRYSWTIAHFAWARRDAGFILSRHSGLIVKIIHMTPLNNKHFINICTTNSSNGYNSESI